MLATNLVPALANNNEWASLGGGIYTHLCLSWLVTASNHIYGCAGSDLFVPN